MASWERKAACAQEKYANIEWFSNDQQERFEARAVCQGECPVRRICLETALTDEHIFGVWGGVDEYEIRRARSVDANNDPIQRSRGPRCPFCSSKNLDVSGKKSKKGYATTCKECELEWHMKMIPTSMKAKRT